MGLTAGTRIGAYEVVAPLGAGGMGEVYRARDTKLGRDVAIKVLPETFSNDADRVARFGREAQLLAALNHPHIAAVYGLEESGGSQFLVLELVEGETLAQRLMDGPLPAAQSLPIAQQIADALQAAHEKGIIHRDLKPANIALTDSGQVKVLDFGLAKALEPVVADATAAGSRADLTHSPTLTLAATQAGVLLGTAAYMAPEQARGRGADKRSDVWAFGCVLYEMLAGKRAFPGEDLTDTLATVLKSEPDWNALPSDVAPPIQVLIRGCLEKNRHQRIADIAAVVFALRITESSYTPPRAVEAPTPWARATIVAVTALVVAGLTSAVWIALEPAPAVPTVFRSSIAIPATEVLVIEGNDRDVAITPDGRHLAYIGTVGATARGLYARPFTQLESQLLVSGAVRGLFTSPDGQWVGFVENGVLKRVAITGGPALMLAPIDGGSRGATWIEDDTVIFATNNTEIGLQQVAAAGGVPQVLTRPQRKSGEADHLWPERLPGGRRVLFTVTSSTGGPDASQIAVLDLDTGSYSLVMRGGSHARYLPSGHLVYAAAGTMRAVPFDLDSLQTRGAPVPVVSRLVTNQNGLGDFAIASDGTLVYADSSGGLSSLVRTLVWVDRSGREEPIAAAPRPYMQPRLSPDGSRLAAFATDEEQDIWVWDFERSTSTRLTFSPSADQAPVWTLDGRALFFSSPAARGSAIFMKPVDGTGAPEQLTDTDGVNQFPTTLAPNGRRLLFNQQGPAGRDVMMLTVGEPRKVDPLVESRFEDRNPAVSPDGRWMAYESDSSGRTEIYVRPFPNVGDLQRQVSTTGGSRPVWSRNGRELFYLDADGILTSVAVQPGVTWSAGVPAKVLQRAYFVGAGNNPSRNYDVARDGQRFVMIKEGATDKEVPPPHIVVVQNWFEELKRLVPAN